MPRCGSGEVEVIKFGGEFAVCQALVVTRGGVLELGTALAWFVRIWSREDDKNFLTDLFNTSRSLDSKERRAMPVDKASGCRYGTATIMMRQHYRVLKMHM